MSFAAALLITNWKVILRLIFMPLFSIFEPKKNDSKNHSRWTNVFLYALWIGVSILSTRVVIQHILRPSGFMGYRGLLNFLNFMPWLKYIFAFFLMDFFIYAFHRIDSAVPFIWRFHAIHHSDPQMDASTYWRKHPLSGFFTSTWMILMMMLFGIPPFVALFFNILSDFWGNMVHSNCRYPDWMQNLFSKLQMVGFRDHSLHHSQDQFETDSNFGQMFIFWDKIFGTYVDFRHRPPIKHGLRNWPEKACNPVILIAAPVTQNYQAFRNQ